MSAPVHRNELQELEAAKISACACLDHYSHILGEARFWVGHHLSAPVLDKYVRESFGLHRPSPNDQTPSELLNQLLKLIHNLIEVLNWGWDAICKADETLLLVTSGPVSAAGVTSTSTCRFAGELAITLWSAIRNTDPQLDPNLDAREPDDPSGSPNLKFTYSSRADGKGPRTLGRFDLREELFPELEQSFQTRLARMPQIHIHQLRAQVEIEIARGRDHVRTRRASTQVSPSGALPTRSRKRDQGFRDRVRGYYTTKILEQLSDRSLKIPSDREIAERVGCSEGTVCRALKDLRPMQSKIAIEDARERYIEDVRERDREEDD
jgi:hypothetical protein